MTQYALAWAKQSQDLGTALLKAKTCYNDMKKDNPDNFFLAPYYTHCDHWLHNPSVCHCKGLTVR